MSRVPSGLKTATAIFEGHCMGFQGIEKAGKEKDIKRSAELFGNETSSAVHVRDKKTVFRLG